jgi:hypothetical protein
MGAEAALKMTTKLALDVDIKLALPRLIKRAWVKRERVRLTADSV